MNFRYRYLCDIRRYFGLCTWKMTPSRPRHQQTRQSAEKMLNVVFAVPNKDQTCKVWYLLQLKNLRIVIICNWSVSEVHCIMEWLSLWCWCPCSAFFISTFDWWNFYGSCRRLLNKMHKKHRTSKKPTLRFFWWDSDSIYSHSRITFFYNSTWWLFLHHFYLILLLQ